MRANSTKHDPVSERLDTMIRLLEDLFIVQAVKAGINKEELRKILAIDRKRVTRISKHMKEQAEG